MATGTVKWFSNDKGYDFITQDDGARTSSSITARSAARGTRAWPRGEGGVRSRGKSEGPAGTGGQRRRLGLSLAGRTAVGPCALLWKMEGIVRSQSFCVPFVLAIAGSHSC
jgi:hypothetical protein